MTNREKYITKRDEYDLMMTIYHNKGQWCPMQIVGAEKPTCLVRITDSGFRYSACRDCIQRWLNEEAKP